MTDQSDKQRMGTGLKLTAFAAVLAAVFALATMAGGALDPDAATGGSDDSHSEEDMEMTHGEHGEGEAPGGLAIAQDGYRLELDRADFAAGERRDLTFRIVGPDGEVVRDFEEEHEAPLHLIVVRRDLTGYQHLHPEMDAAGTWSVPLELPRGGTYRAYADFHTGDARAHARGRPDGRRPVRARGAPGAELRGEDRRVRSRARPTAGTTRSTSLSAATAGPSPTSSPIWERAATSSRSARATSPTSTSTRRRPSRAIPRSPSTPSCRRPAATASSSSSATTARSTPPSSHGRSTGEREPRPPGASASTSPSRG